MALNGERTAAIDDRFLKRAKAIKRLGTKVVSPVELIGELEHW